MGDDMAESLCARPDKLAKETSSSTTLKQKRKESVCPICEEPILEAKGRRKGQDAIFCDGTCHSWLHRGCAGLSRAAFEALGATNKNFYCSCCRLAVLEKTVADMRNKIDKL